MDINYQNLLSVQEILADVLIAVNDESTHLLTTGFYIAQVKLGLDELGFSVSFLPVTEDYPMPEFLTLEMPKGCFNLHTIHIYNGTPDAVSYSENVYWKKNVQTRGKGTGSTSNVHPWNISDPFFKTPHIDHSFGLYYFSVQNGIIRLSDDCANYPYVRLTYDGIPSKQLDMVKMVPPEVRKALVLWVIEKCASYLKIRDGRYSKIQADAAQQLDEYGLNGAWHEAKMRLLKLDKKKLKDSILYNSRFNY